MPCDAVWMAGQGPHPAGVKTLSVYHREKARFAVPSLYPRDSLPLLSVLVSAPHTHRPSNAARGFLSSPRDRSAQPPPPPPPTTGGQPPHRRVWPHPRHRSRPPRRPPHRSASRPFASSIVRRHLRFLVLVFPPAASLVCSPESPIRFGVSGGGHSMLGCWFHLVVWLEKLCQIVVSEFRIGVWLFH